MADAFGNRIVGIAWICAISLSIAFIFRDVSTAWSVGKMAVAGGTVLGRDFANLFTGGRIVLDGHLESIYDVKSYHNIQFRLFDGLVENHNYSYSPISFFYIWAFALTPYVFSYFLWVGTTCGLYYLAAQNYLRAFQVPEWVALILPAVAINIWAGHYGLLIGALWLGAWSLMDKRPRAAGVLVGLMIIKPHMALLMPLALARRRSWDTFFYAGLTVGALTIASGLCFGWAPWREYVGSTLGYQAAMIDDVGEFFLLMMPTVAPALFRMGLSPTFVWTVQILAGLAASAALWFRMPRDPLRAGLATACATFLALPYAFNYDMTVVSLAALVALHRAWWARSNILLLTGVALAFTLPATTTIINSLGIPAAPMLTAILLGIMLSKREFAFSDASFEPRVFRCAAPSQPAA